MSKSSKGQKFEHIVLLMQFGSFNDEYMQMKSISLSSSLFKHYIFSQSDGSSKFSSI